MEIKPIDEAACSQFKAEWDLVATSVTWDIRRHAVGAFEGGKLVGYALFETNGGVGHLCELIVKKSERRQGAGHALVEHFLAFCRQEGCHKAILRTSEDHTEARSFYARLGFAVEANHPNDKNHLMWYTYAKAL